MLQELKARIEHAQIGAIEKPLAIPFSATIEDPPPLPRPPGS